ncbi:ABC transporter ATP-binding protein [Ramlibacter sp.]|uniref:ABC transporter ATP-binding protein n=1 Tax=Ramlibacter sp. TaxID=1917967 RepID=UPI003D145091
MAEIRLEQIEKRWGGFSAVQRQSLHVADHEFLVLLGPSGCGKTTTMRMVAGLEEPTSGDIYIGGRNVTYELPKDRDVAMVFQNYGLYPHMTVGENIAYPLKVRGIAGSEREKRVGAAAAKVELGSLLHRRPRELSGGQRQRVALARALVRTPAAFLMDEPLSNLDAKLRVTMRAELKHLQHELGITTIYVTHDQIEAMTLAHRVAVMDGGVIQQIATPAEIYDRPANLFVAGFIGSPPMNLIPVRCTDGKLVAEGVRVPAAIQSATDDLVLGVRPEDVRLADAASSNVQGRVFTCELTGDSVLVTVQVGASRVIAKADRSFRIADGEPVGLHFDASRLHLFDAKTKRRLD